MKTFRQLIDELPEPVRSKALANTAPHEMDETSFGQECPGFLVFAFDWLGAPEGWQYWRDACDGKFEQPPTLKLSVGKKYRTRDGRVAGPLVLNDAPTRADEFPFAGPISSGGVYSWCPDGSWVGDSERDADLIEEIIDTPAPAPKNNLPELFNRLPEPWRSKAVANCEAWYECPLEEISTTLRDDPGFAFLEGAFPWAPTPEGDEVWRNIRVNGIFPSDEPEEADTHRIADLERRVAALEDRLTVPATCADVAPEPEPERYPTTPLPDGFDRWECRGLGWNSGRRATYTVINVESSDTWARASEGATCGFDNLEYWEAVVKDTPPAPRAYRLLNPGEIIREGDHYQDDEEWHACSKTVGKEYTPSWFSATRRPLKTYEDA